MGRNFIVMPFSVKKGRIEVMELDENLEKENEVYNTWNKHINEKMQENLKNAIKRRNKENLEEIIIEDMGSIDSIEDGVVRCEILDGNMIDLKEKDFKYEIKEGDIVNLKLAYKEGKIVNIDILDKNEEEKRIRLKLMKEQIDKIRNKG